MEPVNNVYIVESFGSVYVVSATSHEQAAVLCLEDRTLLLPFSEVSPGVWEVRATVSAWGRTCNHTVLIHLIPTEVEGVRGKMTAYEEIEYNPR